MNTKITLTHKGVNYTLEYDRMSIKLLEASGFKFDEFLDKPLTNIELAFAGAFIKNHAKVNQSTIDEIYENCKNKSDLIVVLKKMIDECYQSLLSDPTDEGEEGNVTWEIVDSTPVTEKNQG